MYRKIIFPAIALFLFSACNNSADKEEKKTDTTATATSHDGMDHMASTTGNVPALPAVPEGAKVVFANLKEGATIHTPFKLEMGTEVIKIDTAGPVVQGSGHHHLFIDAEDSLAAGETVPKDSTHIHFGKGQTTYELNLSPGKHKLTLQMADGLHRSYGNKLAAVVHVNVIK